MSRSLRELQEQFADDVVVGCSDDGSDNYMSNSNFSGKDLIDVYRNNYTLSLIDALSASYVAVRRLVGDNFFRFIAKEFIKQYPPQSGYLKDYGDNFSAFIKDHETCQSLNYLPDIAKLERFYEKAFHSADRILYDVKLLNNFNEGDYNDLCVDFHPSVQLLDSVYPVLSIWLMDENSEPPKLIDNPQKIIIYRLNLKVRVEAISENEFDLLSRLRDNPKIVESCSDFEEKISLHEFLIKYIQRQVIINFYTA